VISASRANASFMPPNSMSSVVSNVSSSMRSAMSIHQSANVATTVSARCCPAISCASSSPWTVLCRLYHGTQWLPADSAATAARASSPPAPSAVKSARPPGTPPR